MDKKALQFSVVSLEEKKYNVLGRPTLKNTIKFSPQPRSLISQMLHKIGPEGYKCNINNQKSICQLNQDTSESSEDIVIYDDNEDEEDLIHDSFKQTNLEENCNEMTRNTSTQPCKKKSKIKTFKTSPECEAMEDIQCDVCPHRSNNLKEHQKHSATHKIYSCDYPECSYYCKLSSNLTKHKRIHTSEKPFLCDQCTFRTNFVNSLKAHKRLHTAEKPYACTLCSYRCNSSSNLKKHSLHRHKMVFNSNGNIQDYGTGHAAPE